MSNQIEQIIQLSENDINEIFMEGVFYANQHSIYSKKDFPESETDAKKDFTNYLVMTIVQISMEIHKMVNYGEWLAKSYDDYGEITINDALNIFIDNKTFTKEHIIKLYNHLYSDCGKIVNNDETNI